MAATAKSFVGVWQGEHRAGFATITIELQSVGNALSGTWVNEAAAHARQPFPALTIPIVNPQLHGDTLTFVPTNSPATMGIRLISDNVAIFEPILDAAQFNVNDSEILKAIRRASSNNLKELLKKSA